MNSTKLNLIIAASALILASWSQPLHADEPIPAEKAYEKIKSMAGDWYDVNDPNQLVSKIRVVSGGHSVMETLFPGTEKEMISLYHLDGDQLVMTHYCMLGNQPKFKAVATESRIQFEFAGGTNMDSDVDLHIHEGVIEFNGNGHIRSKWTPFQDGKAVEAHEFELKRRDDTSETGSSSQTVSTKTTKAPATCCSVGN